MLKTEEIASIRARLPVRIGVEITTSDIGLSAKVTSPDGMLSNCYTQAANATELVLMVNDAVFTHFEVPEDVRNEIGFYAPVTEAHLQMEKMFNELVSLEKKLEANGDGQATLTLQEAVR